jgi:hypothetical protein
VQALLEFRKFRSSFGPPSSAPKREQCATDDADAFFYGAMHNKRLWIPQERPVFLGRKTEI